MRLSPTVRLGLLFGALYFLQGLVEPGDGLIAQPTRARLERWGWDAAQVAGASLLTALPWSLKPLYGLLSDAVPLLGSRRRGWLALVSAVAAAALAIVALAPADSGLALVLGLAAATMAIAFADVVVDAHMVEVAQPRGLTGTLQAVQWAAIYSAAAIAGALGGRLSAAGAERLALVIAAGGSLTMLALALLAVRDADARATAGSMPYVSDDMSRRTGSIAHGPEDMSPGTGSLAHIPGDGAWTRVRAALAGLVDALRDPGLRCAAVFLALWSFSPGYGAVYDFHLTRGLGLPETLYGDAAAVHAVTCAIASALYGLYCRRVAMTTLLHAAIALGIVSAIGCAFARDPASLMWTSAVGGAAYMSATLVQLDLAARLCPPRLAGSVFALLMAVQNLSLSVAGWLGGHGYELLRPRCGPELAYAALAAAGAACTAACWLLLPALRRRAGAAIGR